MKVTKTVRQYIEACISEKHKAAIRALDSEEKEMRDKIVSFAKSVADEGSEKVKAFALENGYDLGEKPIISLSALGLRDKALENRRKEIYQKYEKVVLETLVAAEMDAESLDSIKKILDGISFD